MDAEAILNESYASRENLGVGDDGDARRQDVHGRRHRRDALGGQSSDVYVKLAQLQKLSDRVGRVNTVYVRADERRRRRRGGQLRSRRRVDGASVTTAADLADRVSGTLVDAKNLAGLARQAR